MHSVARITILQVTHQALPGRQTTDAAAATERSRESSFFEFIGSWARAPMLGQSEQEL